MQETGLRETILNVAGSLFISRGYNAVSIKLIAEEARCTTAALYYYFPEGKEAIRKVVLYSHLPDPEQIVEVGKSAKSLQELFTQIALRVCDHDSDTVRKERWLLAEFPNFTEADREVIHEKLQSIHSALVVETGRFLPDSEAAKLLSWLFMSASFGYGQLFGSLQFNKVAPFPTAEFAEKIAWLLSRDTKS
ncbi:TetR/AcrR family transcriptional regulator [Leptospira adleri]|uniref:TetR/AcrR family transcriptional regulator n=1 Tax=Leptospira adleri TaxID=2023186 RepID=UPI0010834B36|nr:TetR/AcrR family transcriptional regulator [Leptospira adleri]TGM58913.1 TetR/AcrR family transcriptional regulator [Leptospira adleri]